MSDQPVYFVKIMEDIVSSMTITGINYQPGSSNQIVKSLNDLDESITSKGKKYPLIAMVLPVTEKRGNVGAKAGYCTVVIPRIVIATISNYPNDDVLLRYDPTTGVFPTILYPIYSDFLDSICRSLSIINEEPDGIEHSKLDYPNVRRLSSETNDYVDYIELRNMELIINQFKTC